MNLPLPMPLARLALAPVLLWQGQGVRKRALELPEAAGARAGRVGRAKGAAGLRLLIVGDSSAAGVGVRHQREALSGCLVRALREQGVPHIDWTLIAQTGWTTTDATLALRHRELASCNVALVVLGVNDVTKDRSRARWLQALEQFEQVLTERSQAGTVVYSGLPPMHHFPLLPQPLRWYLGSRARLFDEGLQQFVAARAHRRYVALAAPQEAIGAARRSPQASGWIAPDGFHPGPKAYVAWARSLAPVIRGAQP